MSERLFLPVGSTVERLKEALRLATAHSLPVDELHLLVPQGSDDVAAAIQRSLSGNGSTVELIHIPAHDVPAALVETLIGASGNMLSGTVVLLPGGGSDLDAALVVTCERMGIRVMRAVPAELSLEMVLDGDHGSDGSQAADVALEYWLMLPHAARKHLLDPSDRWVNPEGAEKAASVDVTSTVDAMRDRTKKWVDGDIWQTDLLPHMVHHGKEHGRRVDRLATELLLVSPVMRHMSGLERLISIEALSAAAWLHDLGQQGGVLDDTYVREHRHVRQFHGVLSSEIVQSFGADELELKDSALRFLVAQLCKCHQRTAQLDDENRKPLEWCDESRQCVICTKADGRLTESLTGQLALESRQLLSPEVAVALAAILRVADAADIGVHRVNGRWETESGLAERVWRREFVYAELLRYAEALKDDRDAQDVVFRLLTRAKWEATDLAAMERKLKDAREQSGLAKAIRDFDKYLRDQRKHVEKHRFFAGSQIVPAADHTFTIELFAASGWHAQNDANKRARFVEAAIYVWDEYLHSERYFDGKLVPRLDRVVGPDEHVMTKAIYNASRRARG